VGLKPIIPAFERAKKVHALDGVIMIFVKIAGIVFEGLNSEFDIS
jgi:hypothetical protein